MPPNIGLFITATDTEVGKTTLACRIVETLCEQGWPVKPRKPVESGCIKEPDGNLLGADASALFRASCSKEPMDSITPYRFKAPLSPARAAALEGIPLNIGMLEGACKQGVLPNDFLLVEGAGGFYSPLASDGLNADLASRLRLPLLILAPDRLGVIGHVLLTLEAAAHRQLDVAGVVLNRMPDETRPSQLDNLAELSTLAPEINFFHISKIDEMKPLAVSLIKWCVTHGTDCSQHTNP